MLTISAQLTHPPMSAVNPQNQVKSLLLRQEISATKVKKPRTNWPIPQISASPVFGRSGMDLSLFEEKRPIATPPKPEMVVISPNLNMISEYSQSEVTQGGISPRRTYADAMNCGNQYDRAPMEKLTPIKPEKCVRKMQISCHKYTISIYKYVFQQSVGKNALAKLSAKIPILYILT